MKKLLAILLAMVMIMGLFAACGGSADESDEDDDKIVETKENKDDDETDTDVAEDDQDTEETEEENTNPDVTKYIVTVVDEEGNAISDVTIQFCDEEGCSAPVWTVEDGTAKLQTFRRDDKVAKVLEMPEGYTYAGEETEFSFDENDEAIIVLKLIEEPVEDVTVDESVEEEVAAVTEEALVEE